MKPEWRTLEVFLLAAETIICWWWLIFTLNRDKARLRSLRAQEKANTRYLPKRLRWSCWLACLLVLGTFVLALLKLFDTSRLDYLLKDAFRDMVAALGLAIFMLTKAYFGPAFVWWTLASTTYYAFESEKFFPWAQVEKVFKLIVEHCPEYVEWGHFVEWGYFTGAFLFCLVFSIMDNICSYFETGENLLSNGN